MSTPGKTKTVAVPDGWKRLAALYNEDTNSTEIRINGSKVTTVLVTCRTQAVTFAYSDTTPMVVLGHPMATSDSYTVDKMMWVDNCWFKNEVAATIGHLVITPAINF